MRSLFARVFSTISLACLFTLLCSPQTFGQNPGDFIDVFASEPALSFPTGIAVGPDDNLYVGSSNGRAVLRFDGATGAFIDEFAGGDLPVALKRLFWPQGVAFGPDGDLYVASLPNQTVLRFDGSTGAFIDEFVPNRSGGLAGANNLIFGPDGNLYVASLFSNEVLRYDGTSGAFIDIFVTAGSGGLDRPEGLGFGPDGNLYVSSESTNQVLRYDGTTGLFLDVFIAANSGGLNRPHDLLFTAGGELYVSSSVSVLRYDAFTGVFIDVFAFGGSGYEGLLFGPAGDFFASSAFTDQVMRHDGVNGGAGVPFAEKDGLVDPNDIVFGPDGLFYAVSPQKGVLRFDPVSGEFVDVFIPVPVGRFQYLRDILFAPDGLIYGLHPNFVVGGVLRFDPVTGTLIDNFIPAGTGGLRGPADIVIGPDGNFYVADGSTDSVLRYDAATGAFIEDFVASGSGGLDFPNGLIFGPDGNLYVSSTSTSQILRYDGSTGAFLDVFASGGGLNGPFEMLFGPDSNLYVSSGGSSRIIRYDGATGAFIDQFVPFRGGGLAFPVGLLLGPDGNLYVASRETSQVLRYVGPGPIDSDGDGIEDPIDGELVNGLFVDRSNDISDAFTDQHLGGLTFGSIVTRNGNVLNVTDDPTDGVLLEAIGGTDGRPQRVQACSNPIVDIFLIDGDQMIVTCGSFTGETLIGSVDVTVGRSIGVTIPAGAIAFIEELPGSIVSISNLGETGAPDIKIEEGGIVSNLGPDDPPFVTTLGDDGDDDSVPDEDDNCPFDPNSDQLDGNMDGIGDACQPACDIDLDGDVDRADIGLIMAARNTSALAVPGDPRDNDNDGTITANDARQCTLICTRTRCAVE